VYPCTGATEAHGRPGCPRLKSSVFSKILRYATIPPECTL